MTAFIRQEAMEKANEIRLKADEEFAIEKSKLVRQEQASIDSSYEKKFKQASMSQQITRSTVSNKSRLRILSARQELLNKLFEQFGAVELNVALTALVIGSALLMLSAFWHQARTMVVRPLPESLRERLPLIDRAAPTPQPAA